MQIKDSMNEWCKAENRRRSVRTSITIWFITIGAVAAVSVKTSNMHLVAMAVLLLLAWAIFAEKPLTLSSLAYSSSWAVPDSLLKHIADDAAVPTWAKQSIADALLKGPGSIEIRFLLELDGRIKDGEESAQRMDGDGFKAMAAFSSAGEKQQGNDHA